MERTFLLQEKFFFVPAKSFFQESDLSGFHSKTKVFEHAFGVPLQLGLGLISKNLFGNKKNYFITKNLS